MSLGSSDMAGSALGTAFSLLLLASIIQGRQEVEVLHYEKMEAVVGQNVSLPCIVKNNPDLKVVSIEWNKNRNKNTKLALYSPSHGLHLFWPNVTIQIVNKSMGAYLQLSGVTKWDSDIYICDLTTYPLGSIRKETELKIKDVDVKVTCDVNGTVEALAGENVTIHCGAVPHAGVQYRWTKNKTLVSENKSLELSWVTDAHTGVYTLTVNTGNTSLHKEFIITVLTATTSLQTDTITVSPQSNITEEGFIESSDSGLTTSATTGLSTIDTSVSWSMSIGSDVTDDTPTPSNVTISTGAHVTSFTNYISVTSSPATHTEPYPFNNSNDPTTLSHILNTSTSSDQSLASNPPTTLSYGSTVLRSTQETRNESMLYTGSPVVNSSTSLEESSTLRRTTENFDDRSTTPNRIGDKDTRGARSHLLLVLIIVPILVLIAVAGFLYRRQTIKQRMDLPPPFKPPPPPIKYTSARRSEISTQAFPVSRCNSVTELKEMKQRFTNV